MSRAAYMRRLRRAPARRAPITSEGECAALICRSIYSAGCRCHGVYGVGRCGTMVWAARRVMARVRGDDPEAVQKPSNVQGVSNGTEP